MPRSNYGNAVKQRAIQFFTVLVDYANDELDIEERQLEQLQRDIQLHWQTDKRCVIRTKVRYLENLTNLVGINIDPKLQQDLVTQFKLGRVWMLLDAVDEMGIDASIALANLARQLRRWVGGAHIILTCRSNVWDNGKNALENFTTYRNLSLSNGYSGSPDRVKQFIQVLI